MIEGYKVPDLVEQLSKIRLEDGNDRSVPPNDYYLELRECLSKEQLQFLADMIYEIGHYYRWVQREEENENYN